MNPNKRLFQSLVLLIALPSALFAADPPRPTWIWHPNDGASATNGEIRLFRKVFTVDQKIQKAVLTVAADNSADIFLNEKMAIAARGYERASATDVTGQLKNGTNLFAVRGLNDNGPAGFLLRLEITLENKEKIFVVSDTSWITGVPVPEDRSAWRGWKWIPSDSWVAAKDVRSSGGDAWKDALKPASATPADEIATAPGFKIELLRSSAPGEGSWICMTVDQKGRLIISPQRDDQSLLRVTLSRGKVAKVEPVPAPLRQAMGMCYAHDSLYVNGHGPKGTGLYRLIDANRNDLFETNEVHFLKKFEGEGEHGYHAVVEGPDKMMYVMNGNHTKVPEGVTKDSPHQRYGEDLFLPRQWDANGHAVGILAPGGYVVRTDPAGKNWELMLAGFRNSYDFDFNADGEMFTFDSDMEWDWGLPWYKPTRVIHCVTGGEYGWRSGTSNEPEYYADTLPATVDIGIGSPTGVKFGTKSKYPEKYQKAFYAMDWSYGRILAVHLTPNGATYSGTAENFVKGKPLNVADLEFGKDGAMYFITGGRGTQSGLYRVSYIGGEPKATKETADTKRARQSAERAAGEARKLRQQLEAYHGKNNPVALGTAWPHLGSPDRFIRNAARIAVESQDLALWKSRALAEKNPQAGLVALMAVARCGGRDTQNDLLVALSKFKNDSLTLDQVLEKLRIYEVSFARQGKPEPIQARRVAEELNPLYPSKDQRFNHELSQLLVFLEAPDYVTKTLDLLARAKTQEEQIHYIFQLRNAKSGWTTEQRQKYFGWFTQIKQSGKGEVTYPAGAPYNVWTNQALAIKSHPQQLIQWFKDVGREYGDGSSFSKFLINIRKDAVAKLTSTDRKALSSVLEEGIDAAPWKPTMERKFVQEWTVEEIAPQLDKVATGRDFRSGKAAFNDAQCIACHRFGNEGGSVGPELTGVGSKYSRRDILESLIEPSKVVSDQFQNSIIVKKDGDDVSGRITDENKDRIIVLPNMLSPEVTVEVPVSEIAKREPSKVSPMPTGLLNNLTQDEILDLLAYMEASGRAGASNFKRDRPQARSERNE